MKCYIVDDEQHAIESLSRHIEKVTDISLVGSSRDPLSALREICDNEIPDIVFLDVDMPGLSGIELGELLPKRVNIIFTTAFANYAYNAFQLNAVDFLLKPISFPKFLKAIEKARERMSVPGLPGTEPITSVFINPGVRGKVIQLHYEDILYVEGLKNYIIIYTRNGGKHITYLKMNEFMEALPERCFCRVHRSFIVNISAIASIEGNQVQLQNLLKIPIGVSYREVFMQFIGARTVRTNR